MPATCDFPRQELFVRPCPVGAKSWHRQSLAQAGSTARTIDSCRADYHRAMLESLGGGPPPLVSIVIPAYNEAEQLLRTAVESALAQTYPRCEVIVVDDGAERPVADTLAELADRVEVIRQPNQGVAAARKRGIAAARGELVHFLDADDLLDRDSVERKVQVFLDVADVDLCFSLYRCEGDNGVKSASNHEVPPVGDAFCPSQGLLRTVLKRFPFQISSVMMPKWVLLDSGPFEVDLRQSQDNRHWFKLALRSTKVAGLKAPLSTRRFRSGSLTSRAEESAWYSLISYGRNLIDLCASPTHWTCIPAYTRRLLAPARIDLLFYSDAAEIEQFRRQLLEAIGQMAELQSRDGLSCGPAIEAMRYRFIELSLLWNPSGPSDFQNELLRLIDELEPQALPLSERDFVAWLSCESSRPYCRENYPALRHLERNGSRTFLSPGNGRWREQIRRLYLSPACGDVVPRPVASGLRAAG